MQLRRDAYRKHTVGRWQSRGDVVGALAGIPELLHKGHEIFPVLLTAT